MDTALNSSPEIFNAFFFTSTHGFRSWWAEYHKYGCFAIFEIFSFFLIKKSTIWWKDLFLNIYSFLLIYSPIYLLNIRIWNPFKWTQMSTITHCAGLLNKNYVQRLLLFQLNILEIPYHSIRKDGSARWKKLLPVYLHAFHYARLKDRVYSSRTS